MKKVTQCVFTIIFFITYGNTSTPKQNLTIDCGVTRFGDAWGEGKEANKSSSRIVNGHVAEIGQIPWSARLGNKYVRYQTIFTSFHCGGSLITSRFVISAAHCDARANIVRLGQTTLSDKECDSSGTCAPPYQDVAVKSFTFEAFCRKSQRNDLMLVELFEPAKLNDFVSPICLSPSPRSAKDFVGKKVYVSGWGRQISGDSDSFPSNLLYIPLTVRETKRCKLRFYNVEDNNQLCLGSSKGQHVCRGDSGSGDFYFETTDDVKRAYLVGLVSYGTPSCLHDSVHTYVDFYMENILKIIGESQEEN